ncbi:hypothetical protein LINGRAHAP2_LOCUS23421 [Linum grandiflorum]
MYKREKESRAYERDVMVCAFKEAEWRQEKKKLKEEVKRLRKLVEEKEERIRGLECGIQWKPDEEGDNNWLLSGTATTFLLQQMREERALRDEAVDKWKKLYLAIKTELDRLIQNTHPGPSLSLASEEEETIDELKMEAKMKEEIIEDMKARLIVAEREEFNRAREVDILRQSLRIISSKKQPGFILSKPKFSLVKRVVKVVN